jgi:hypothetical protein
LHGLASADLSPEPAPISLLASPTLAKPRPLRFVGALGTLLTGTVMSGALLL